MSILEFVPDTKIHAFYLNLSNTEMRFQLKPAMLSKGFQR